MRINQKAILCMAWFAASCAQEDKTEDTTRLNSAGRPDPGAENTNLMLGSAPGGLCANFGRYNSLEHIKSVKIEGLTDSSGADAGGYRYVDGLNRAKPSQTIKIALTPGFSGAAYPENWKVWLDLNFDGRFSADEILFSAAQSSATVSGTFTIPRLLSARTYIRVIMAFGSLANDGCVQPMYGEVQDYVVETTANPWRGIGKPADVNNDYQLSNLDLQKISNTYYAQTYSASSPLPPFRAFSEPSVDVNADGYFTAIDVLTVQTLSNNGQLTGPAYPVGSAGPNDGGSIDIPPR